MNTTEKVEIVKVFCWIGDDGAYAVFDNVEYRATSFWDLEASLDEGKVPAPRILYRSDSKEEAYKRIFDGRHEE